MMKLWTEEEVKAMIEHYPLKGRMAMAAMLGRTSGQVRSKAARLGLRADMKSDFRKAAFARGAAKATGKKRPEHSLKMKSLHDEGKMPRITETGRASIARKMKDRIAKSGHPRGYLGKRHSEETRKKLSSASIRGHKNRTPEKESRRIRASQETKLKKYGSIAPNVKRGNWAAGWREVGGVRKYYRSRWEANYARLLESMRVAGEISSWSHEPTVFWFDKIKRGCKSYLPDFMVTFPCGRVEYHEVKGWMDDKSKTKIKRMRIYHPEVILLVVDGDRYKKLEKENRDSIPGWEIKSKKKQ